MRIHKEFIRKTLFYALSTLLMMPQRIWEISITSFDKEMHYQKNFDIRFSHRTWWEKRVTSLEQLEQFSGE